MVNQTDNVNYSFIPFSLLEATSLNLFEPVDVPNERITLRRKWPLSRGIRFRSDTSCVDNVL